MPDRSEVVVDGSSALKFDVNPSPLFSWRLPPGRRLYGRAWGTWWVWAIGTERTS